MTKPTILLVLSAVTLILTCSDNHLEIDLVDDIHRDLVDHLYSDYDDEFKRYLQNANRHLGTESIRLEPLSQSFTTPKLIRIGGSPFELGRSIGHIARQHGVQMVLRTPQDNALNEQIIEMYQRIYPPYLDIVEGIAQSYDLDLEDLHLPWMEYEFFVYLWWDVLQYDRFARLTDFGTYGDMLTGCSVASYNLPGHHIVGRNFDNPSDRPHYFAQTALEGCYGMKGNVVYCFYHWVVDGINEKGLSINVASNGEEYNWRDGYPDGPAVFSGHMARIVMDTCGTVEEAIAKIGSAKIWFPNEGVHWMISDATGQSVVVEFDLDRKMVVIDREGPFELITNTALQKGERYVRDNCWRYRTAVSELERGIGDQNEMAAIMRAIRPMSGSSRTLWTSVMDLNERSFRIHYRKEYGRTYTFAF